MKLNKNPKNGKCECGNILTIYIAGKGRDKVNETFCDECEKDWIKRFEAGEYE